MEPQEATTTPQPAGNGAAAVAVMSEVAAPVSSAGVSVATPLSPVQADDTDVLEDGWIDVVERIVKEQQHDPYMLNRAMTLARADYMKKRYNREVKNPD